MTESFRQIARKAAAESAGNIDEIQDESTQLKRELETPISEHLTQIAGLIEREIVPLLSQVPEIQTFIMTLAPPTRNLRMSYETVRFENNDVRVQKSDDDKPQFHYYASFANHQIVPYDRSTFTLLPDGQWKYTATLPGGSPGMISDWEAGGPDKIPTCLEIEHSDLKKEPEIVQKEENIDFTVQDVETITLMLATLAGHIQSGEVAALYENAVLKMLNEQASND